MLIAIQGVDGDITHPATKNAYIDYTQATSQKLEESTRMANDVKAPPTDALSVAAQQSLQNTAALGARS